MQMIFKPEGPWKEGKKSYYAMTVNLDVYRDYLRSGWYATKEEALKNYVSKRNKSKVVEKPPAEPPVEPPAEPPVEDSIDESGNMG